MRRCCTAATRRSFSSVSVRRISSTRWSWMNSFSRSRASMARCSSARRSFWMRSTSASRCPNSSSSCSSIMRRRSSKLASSVMGGSAASNAFFCRWRSISSTSAFPAGSPLPNVNACSPNTAGSSPSFTTKSGVYGSVCASDSRNTDCTATVRLPSAASPPASPPSNMAASPAVASAPAPPAASAPPRPASIITVGGTACMNGTMGRLKYLYRCWPVTAAARSAGGASARASGGR
mmetsp:Transcript_88461/g.214455  ORF Transcript_88461/g.214455 Transcript_88461/m.214455 type:complete len:235 (-) Transcript_88461:25-729(-)